jgi:hypothetical protein
MTAMAGMFLMGSPTFASFGVGTVLVVAIALLGSLTVLPAVLAKLGDRVERGRIPFLARVRDKDGDSRFWGAVVGAVMRHPVVLGGAATALLVALAMPAFSLHTVSSGAQGLPRDLPVMQVYDRIQRAFPGGGGPAVVVVSAPDVLVLVFQQGHLESLLGFTSIGGVTDWPPLFLFVILFGLSMDYHVLILSRVGGVPRIRHEHRGRRRPRHPRDRKRRDQRGAGHGCRVRDLRDPEHDRLQDDGRRPGGRRADRRDRRPRGPPAGHDEAARRLELVSPALARMAAAHRPRGSV